jgi:hypothetical protein
MYCDPLAAEGLFPLAEDDTKTERDLPYEFKPGVDYFAKFDAIMPPWTIGMSTYQKVPLSSAAWTEDAGGPVEVRMPKRRVLTLSHRRYARCVHPDGGLRQLIISTVRATPAFPDGFDACATAQRFTAKKWNLGWIPVENADWIWTPFAKLRGQEYAAWAWAVMEYRQKRHAAHEASEGQAFMSRAERAANKQTEVIAKALEAALSRREEREPEAPRRSK